MALLFKLFVNRCLVSPRFWEAHDYLFAQESDNQWHAQALVADGDSKTTAKFRKLMGIKDGETKETVTTTVTSNEDDFIEEQRKKQEELFQQLDKEYHFARIATHTQRGAGLGFGSQSGSFH